MLSTPPRRPTPTPTPLCLTLQRSNHFRPPPETLPGKGPRTQWTQ